VNQGWQEETMDARSVRLLLIALVLVLVLLPTGLVMARQDTDDSLWAEAEFAFKSGNRQESLRLLRLCVLGRLNLPDSELMLRQALASETAAISAGRPINELSRAELDDFYKLQSEICTLGITDAGDWLLLMKASLAVPGSQNLIVSGQAFLDAVERGLPVVITHDWHSILEKLDQELVRDEQVLYRLQIARIFAGLEPESRELQQKLADIRLVADAKAVKILRFAEVEMALGNLAAARACLDQVRSYDPGYSGLADMYRLLERSEHIDRILVQANDAVLSRNFEEAKRRADEVFALDPNNFFARRIIEQVEEARQRPAGAAMSEADRVQLKIRRLENELRAAEKDEDLLKISACLREILMLKNDPASALKLAAVDEEIAFSRLKSEERFAEAEIMFRKGDYAKLRLFLNRNPGLMNSLEKMLQIWEMRLMANFATGNLDSARLREAAIEINRRAGRSFYASYVLMRLDIAENKFADARGHYQIAAELKPGDVSLRWPGILLWAHGDGRPVAVIVLIVIFLLLIKLIVPFFAWFESTYWWRISLLSKVFPSLAIGSLESCFGAVTERSERITLFTLLMKSCYRVGQYDKATLYAENLLELVPGSAAALEIKGKVKNRTTAAGKAPEIEKKSVVATGNESDSADVPVDEADEDSQPGLEVEYNGGLTEAGADEYHEDSPAEIPEEAAEEAAEEDQPVAVEEYSAVADTPEASEEAKPESEPDPLPAPAAKNKEADMIWYDDEEEQKRKTEGVAEVMADLFNDFFTEKPATPVPEEPPAVSREDRIKQRLFSELDAVQAPESASEAWLNCDGNTQRGRLFKDLDQGR